ncbi:HNH endonuclease signature motif containing protein [Arthrobacter sp. Sr24]
MGKANWPGSSEESNLSGPSVSGSNPEQPLESQSAANFETPQESPSTARPQMPNKLSADPEWIHRNVLRFAEPLTMPRPIMEPVYGGPKRVQRLLPPMTAEEQANYIEWTPQRGAAALAELDPNDLDDEELLNYIQASERQASWAMARQAAAIDVFATRRPPVLGEEPPAKHPDRSRYAAAELMALFAIGSGAAEHLISDAELLVQHLPDTFALFDDGCLDVRRVRAVIRGCENTPPQILHQLEPKFLDFAMSCNPNALTRKVRGIAERHNPEPIEQRHRRARTSRDVWITPLPDGMAYLGARLPATDAALLFNSLEDWAKAAKSNGEDSHGITPTGRPSRSLGEYRADVLIDLMHQMLLHNSSGSAHEESNPAHNNSTQQCGPYFKNRIPAVLNITVSADRLLGKSSDPATLEGFGAIPIDDEQELAATAKFWRRFLTDPDSGRIVSVGRKTRKPPKAMAREVRFRDPVCTGIGCDRPARSCELDHTTPYNRFTYTDDGVILPLGETSIENLRPRCPYCHHLKDDPHTGWTVENVSPGVTRTVTPTGRVYIQTQGDVAPPF